MAEEERFGELRSQVARAITQRQASEVCRGDLTLEQYQTLRAVSAADQPSLRSLSASLRLDRARTCCPPVAIRSRVA